MGSDQDVAPSKVSDSGVGGLESGEESWISDTEVSHKEDHSVYLPLQSLLNLTGCLDL